MGGEKLEKKVKLYILLAFIAVIVLLGISSFTDAKYSQNNGLTYDQKKKDAEYLDHVLKEVYPFYESERKAGNIGSKSNIINTISKTKTDEEFFNAVLSVIGNFKEGITHVYPQQLNSRESVILDEKYGIDETNFMTKSFEGQRKWEELFQKKQGFKEYIAPEVYVDYFEGEYFIIATKNPNLHPGDKIIKIQGINIEEYLDKNFNSKSSGVYFRTYDSKREKDVVLGDLFQLSDKNAKAKVSIIGKEGEEKEVEVGADDPNKPFLYTENVKEDEYYEKDKKGFLNILEDGKIVVLNFSMEGAYNIDVTKEQIYKAIDNSEYLVLDGRRSGGGEVFQEVLNYISKEEIKLNRYNIMKKNQYSDQIISNLQNQFAAVFEEQFTINAHVIDEKFPPSQYHRLKSQEAIIKGQGKYKGKAFIFSDAKSYMPISNTILRILNRDNNITFISNNNLEIQDENYFAQMSNVILPNSNLVITMQISRVVDEEGKPIIKESIKPDYIIDEDKKLYISQLRGEINPLYYDNLRRYTDKDEYYKKFLEVISGKK